MTDWTAIRSEGKKSKAQTHTVLGVGFKILDRMDREAPLPKKTPE